jgi:hypothetical protein
MLREVTRKITGSGTTTFTHAETGYAAPQAWAYSYNRECLV